MIRFVVLTGKMDGDNCHLISPNGTSFIPVVGKVDRKTVAKFWRAERRRNRQGKHFLRFNIKILRNRLTDIEIKEIKK